MADGDSVRMTSARWTVFVGGCMLLLFHKTVGFPRSNLTAPVPRIFNVTLHVFSGRQDPECELKLGVPFFREITAVLEAWNSTQITGNLGYRGLTAEGLDDAGRPVLKTVGRRSNVLLEDMMVDGCFQLDPAVHSYVKSAIHQSDNDERTSPDGKPKRSHVSNHNIHHVLLLMQLLAADSDDEDRDGGFLGKRRRKRQAVCESPQYNPVNWSFRRVRRNNNCYNYATDIRTDTFAQPGRSSGVTFREYSGAEVLQATERDGLIPLNSPSRRRLMTRGSCLIALVTWPGVDFHFYRLDNNGLWSHKSGSTRVTNLDDSLNLIRDPRTADRGPYTEFTAFLSAPFWTVIE